jgi:hypothetical protein
VASVRPINVIIKGDYTDKDIQRAIKDLDSLKKSGPHVSKSLSGISKSMKGLGLAAGIAVTAMGALAISMGIDSVKAALSEEKAIAKFNRTLKNLHMSKASAGMLQWADDMQYATGVSEDELRPGLERMLMSVRDVTKAQELMSLAMDIAAGTGKPLTTVVAALGKAADGNMTGLGRLGIGLDKTWLKYATLDDVLLVVGRNFKGQAAAAADTMTGKFNRMTVAVDELKESAGVGFLDGLFGDGLDGSDQAIDDLKNMRTEMELVGKAAGMMVKDVLGWTVDFMRGAMTIANAWSGFTNEVAMGASDLKHVLGLTNDKEYLASVQQYDRNKKANESALVQISQFGRTPPKEPRPILRLAAAEQYASDQRVNALPKPALLGGSVVNHYHFTGSLIVRSPVDAVEQAKKIARLRALSGQRGIAALAG